jgi:hypothetical protein
MTVADCPANLVRFTKQRGGATGGSSYPMMRLVALVACGTRTIIDAVYGPITTGETSYAPQLLTGLQPGMILLADRNFAAGHLLAVVAGTGAQMLVRTKTGRGGPRLPVLRRHPDGSYRSTFGGVAVRVVDAEITIATKAGRVTGVYRLITTLLDDRRYPAFEIVKLYHERWEIETAYLELKSSILGGRVLRARTPAGVDQEIYALLVTYQILRTAMADATNSHPDLDPDPDQLHRRPTRRPRPDRAGRRGHRRHRHRPGRRDRPCRAGQPVARPAVTRQRPHRQTSDIQIQRPRPQHRPSHLQSDPQHRHPHRPDLDNRPRTLTTRHCL